MRVFLLLIFTFSLNFTFAEDVHIPSEKHESIIDNLEVGQCVLRSGEWPVYIANPDVSYSGLHPGPDFQGCFPRIVIKGNTLGLVTRVMMEIPPNLMYCRYYNWDDIIERNGKFYDCPVWPTD